MEDKLHPVVTLLIKRIESHPEEFGFGAGRWDWIAERVQTHGSAEERAAIKAALRPIRLKEIHEDMMDELCNGDERRRKEEEEHKYERRLMQQAGSFGKPLTAARHPTIDDMKNNGILNSIRNIWND